MPKVLFQNKERFYHSVPSWNGRLRFSFVPSPIVRYRRETPKDLELVFPEGDITYGEITSTFVHFLNLGQVFGEELQHRYEAHLMTFGFQFKAITECRTDAIEKSYYSCKTKRDSHVLRDMEKEGLLHKNPIMSEGQMQFR